MSMWDLTNLQQSAAHLVLWCLEKVNKLCKNIAENLMIFCRQKWIELNPETTMSDYEIGTIKAIKNKYQGLPVKFIFSFNMCQKK